MNTELMKERRLARGLTQVKLAFAIDTTPQMVWNWENGKSLPSTQNLLKLSRALGVHMEDLLADEGDE